jgi:anti-anti-sigma factor
VESVSATRDDSFSAEVVTGRDAAVISLKGALDLASVGSLNQVIEPLLHDSNVDLLIFDVGALRFIDSSGLAVLLRVAAAGKSVHLRDASRLVRELVTVTGVGGLLVIDP